MKKLAPVLCGIIFLSGCSEKNSGSTDTDTSVETTTAFRSLEIVTEELPPPSLEVFNQPIDFTPYEGEIVDDSRFTFELNGNVLKIFDKESGDEPIQIIEDGFSDMYGYYICDLDFDGIEDIRSDTPPYRYMRFDPETGKFADIPELNALGLSVEVSEMYENTYEYSSYDDLHSYTIYYHWENGKIVPFKKCCSTSYADTFDWYEMCDEGFWVKVTRSIGGFDSKVIENPLYFRINEDSVDVMQGKKVIQTLEGYRLPEYAEKVDKDRSIYQQYFNITADSMLYEADFDFDGNNDLFIYRDYNEGTGDYYRYDPDEGKFVPWDELDSFGKLIRINSQDNTLYTHSDLGKEYEYMIYAWSGSKLHRIRREVHSYGTVNGMEQVDIYKYDDNGDETVSHVHTEMAPGSQNLYLG